MKLVLIISLAFAEDSAPAPEETAPPEESVVAQAVQMNEELSEILARVKELKSVAEGETLIESKPIKKVEPVQPSK